VPQRFAVEAGFPLSVREFLLMKTDENKIADLLEMTGLGDDKTVLDKSLSSLSGGQLQRVMIAWAIANDPDIILFDEPLTGIDVGGEETIYNLLDKLNKEQNKAIITISHDLGMVFKYAKQVLCLNKKMVCLGEPKEVITHETTEKLYGHLATHHDHNHDHSKEINKNI